MAAFEPLNITIRALLALTFLFGATKILTKRSFANLTYFDHIAAATLGTLAGNLAFNLKVHMYNFMLSIVLVTAIIVFASFISLKFRPLRRFLAGFPTVLIQNGKVLELNLARMNYSFDYLNEQLREQQIFDISKVEFAILEPSGKLSVLLKSQYRSLTPKDMGISTQYEGLATEVVLDGKVVEPGLAQVGLGVDWLMGELGKKGVGDVKEVAFAALGTNGKLYVDRYGDFG